MSTLRQFASLFAAGTAAALPGGRAASPSFPGNLLVNSLTGAGLRNRPHWASVH